MKRVCLLMLCLALCCALFACGKPVPEPALTTQEPTTAIETTTEMPTTEEPATEEESTPVLPVLTDLMETDAALDFEKSAGYMLQEIWLRDKATGEETLLLGRDSEGGTFPYFRAKVNERYFVFQFAYLDSEGGSYPKIYDLQNLREAQVNYSAYRGYNIDFDRVADGKIYLHAFYDYDVDDEATRYFFIPIAALAADGPIIPKEVR